MSADNKPQPSLTKSIRAEMLAVFEPNIFTVNCSP